MISKCLRGKTRSDMVEVSFMPSSIVVYAIFDHNCLLQSAYVASLRCSYCCEIILIFNVDLNL